jgi:hypothetical protein
MSAIMPALPMPEMSPVAIASITTRREYRRIKRMRFMPVGDLFWWSNYLTPHDSTT